MRIQIKKQGGGRGRGNEDYCFFQALLLVRRRWVNINANTLGENIQQNKNNKLQPKCCFRYSIENFVFLQGIWFRRRLEILSEELSIKHELIRQLFCIITMAMFDLLFPSCSSLRMMHGLYLKLEIQLFFRRISSFSKPQ